MTNKNDADVRAQVDDLLTALNAGDGNAVTEALDQLTRFRESELFRELGSLTRDLHEAIKTFEIDSRLTVIAEVEIPDAKQRLEHVIETTEQAAHKTLNAIEDTLNTADSLAKVTLSVNDRWTKFRNKELNLDEFRELAVDLDQFFNQALEEGEIVRQKMNDVLMAQEFQDITGQILRRVIKMVQEVEDNLVHLVRISSTGGKRVIETVDMKTKELEGPKVPGTSTAQDTVSGQDEVDDLLSSLGF